MILPFWEEKGNTQNSTIKCNSERNLVKGASVHGRYWPADISFQVSGSSAVSNAEIGHRDRHDLNKVLTGATGFLDHPRKWPTLLGDGIGNMADDVTHKDRAAAIGQDGAVKPNLERKSVKVRRNRQKEAKQCTYRNKARKEGSLS